MRKKRRKRLNKVRTDEEKGRMKLNKLKTDDERVRMDLKKVRELINKLEVKKK